MPLDRAPTATMPNMAPSRPIHSRRRIPCAYRSRSSAAVAHPCQRTQPAKPGRSGPPGSGARVGPKRRHTTSRSTSQVHRCRNASSGRPAIVAYHTIHASATTANAAVRTTWLAAGWSTPRARASSHTASAAPTRWTAVATPDTRCTSHPHDVQYDATDHAHTGRTREARSSRARRSRPETSRAVPSAGRSAHARPTTTSSPGTRSRATPATTAHPRAPARAEP